MSCVQVTVSWPSVSVGRKDCIIDRSYPFNCKLYFGSSSSFSLRCGAPPVLRSGNQGFPYKRGPPVCVFGGKGNSESKDEDFSWDSLKKAMENFQKGPSVQDKLREQIVEQDFDGDGGGDIPPGPGSGGDGSGAEDEGFMGILDELFQVILATIFFVFVYIYMIRGEELSRLAKDYIFYLFGVRASVRLRKAMYNWKQFWKKINRKVITHENWLERKIVRTPTVWHKPRELVRAVKSGRVRLDEVL